MGQRHFLCERRKEFTDLTAETAEIPFPVILAEEVEMGIRHFEPATLKLP